MSDYFYKYVGGPIESIGRIFTRSKTSEAAKTKVQEVIAEVKPKIQPFNYYHLPVHSRNLIRLAGLSGLTAVVLSAYGAHVFRRRNTNADLKELYNTAQYYHLVHSVALFGLPLVKRPVVTGSLWVSGMILFCGTMYYHALSEDTSLKMLTPYGGMCLIIGWLSVFI